MVNADPQGFVGMNKWLGGPRGQRVAGPGLVKWLESSIVAKTLSD